MQTHTAAFRRLAACLLALALAAAPLSPVFAAEQAPAAESISSPASAPQNAPEAAEEAASAGSEPAAGEAENTPPPPRAWAERR